MGKKIKSSIKIKAEIEITDEIRQKAEEVLGITDDNEIADRILVGILDRGIQQSNSRDYDWKGIGILNNQIKEYRIEPFLRLYSMGTEVK